MKERGKDPRIVLNSMDSASRRRFTCAHELGHFMQRSEQPDEYEYVDFATDARRAARTSTSVSPTHSRALFMPEGTSVDCTAVASERSRWPCFGVSREAMHYRLKNLGIY